MIWAQEVYYRQKYPTEKTCKGWVFAEKEYTYPRTGSISDTDGQIKHKQLETKIFVCILNPRKHGFRRNIQREKANVRFTGQMLSMEDFEETYGTRNELMREWNE